MWCDALLYAGGECGVVYNQRQRMPQQPGWDYPYLQANQSGAFLRLYYSFEYGEHAAQQRTGLSSCNSTWMCVCASASVQGFGCVVFASRFMLRSSDYLSSSGIWEVQYCCAWVRVIDCILCRTVIILNVLEKVPQMMYPCRSHSLPPV